MKELELEPVRERSARRMFSAYLKHVMNALCTALSNLEVILKDLG